MRKNVRTKTARAAFKAFLSITGLWDLEIKEQLQLLCTTRATFLKWKKADHPELPEEKIERISYLLGIYNALQLLLPIQAADTWVKKRNKAPLFAGKSALDYMLQGRVADLYEVRQYLDRQLSPSRSIL
jgi:hypothetical protein